MGRCGAGVWVYCSIEASAPPGQRTAMPAPSFPWIRMRFATGIPAVVILAFVFTLFAHAQPPEPPKKPAEPNIVRLPDGTYLWVGDAGNGPTEQIKLTPQELQKVLDQLELLKKQLAARKPTPPSGCAIRGRVEKRGEQLVAMLKLTYSFRTLQPQTAVALGGRKGFLVTAALDGSKLPVLDTTDDGFAVFVESVGEHTLTLDLEVPITVRGVKPELGFELGLPRSVITTLLFEPPGPDVKFVSLTTRTPDSAQPTRPPEIRRVSAFDVKQLASRPGREGGHPLGPADSLEVTWDPPATAAQPADQVQSSELDVAVLLTEGVVETTAKFKLRGPSRTWKVVAPATADLSADRSAIAAEAGPVPPATVTRPTDAAKPVWVIELPAGSLASDWVITAVTRQQRPKTGDAKYGGPFSVGPFATLDVLRQTGTVRVTAGPHTRFAFRHGPDMRKAEPPEPPEDDRTVAFFRLTTGPTGTMPVNSPLFTLEARPQEGAIRVTPNYRLTLTEAGWQIRSELKITPIRTEAESLTINVPIEWHGLEASPPELVEGVQQGELREGFWAATGLRAVNGLRVPVIIRLAAPQKQSFDLVLTATFPVGQTDSVASIPLPRFSGAVERDTTVMATVSDGLEVRGEARERAGEFVAWGVPLETAQEIVGRTTRAITVVTGKAETGLSRVILAWNAYRPPLAANTRADVTLGDRQMVIVQHITLRSPEALPRPIRFRGPTSPAALRTVPALDIVGPGEWSFTPPADAKEATLTFNYALPIGRSPDESTPIDIPVGFLWPTGTTRAEATVRVWSNAAMGRTITTTSPGWLETPAEPTPDRDTLPSLTLTASGTEPLALEARPNPDTGAAVVWADRGLIEAWGGGDAATSYRARFLLRRWLTPSIELTIPSSSNGSTPEFYRDGQKLEATPVSRSDDRRDFRVALPASRPGATTVIEVRYQLTAARGRMGESLYSPPELPRVAFSGPVRWLVTVPDSTVPLLLNGANAEFRWWPRATGLTPRPTASPDSMEWWLRTGEEVAISVAEDAEGVAARQSTLAPLTIVRVPRTAMIIACSVVAFVLVLFLARLSGALIGPAVAVFAAIIGIVAALYPQPAAQTVGAAQPGLLAALAVLLVLAAAKWSHRRRITRMPGFSRSVPEASAPRLPMPSSARGRQSSIGSAGATPVTPVGG